VDNKLDSKKKRSVVSLGAGALANSCSRGAPVRPEVLYCILLPSFYGFVFGAPRSPIRGVSVVVIRVEGTRLLPNRFSFAHGATS
jgi:hypothetical protein